MRKGLVLPALALGAASFAYSGEVHFRTSTEEPAVKNRFRAGDRIPLGGYAVDVGWMETFTEDAFIVNDPSCDPLSNLALMIDGTTRAGEAHGEHTMADPPKGVYDFSTKIGAVRTNIFGAQFGTQSPLTGFQFFFVQFGGDGTIWVMNQSTGIPYRNVEASDCARGVDNRIQVGWKMNFDDRNFYVTIDTFGTGATRGRFGPFPIPAPLQAEGWDHCIYRVPPETGRYYFDGVVCIADSPPIFDPTGGENHTRR